MLPNLGYGVLLLTFLVALYGIGAALHGARIDASHKGKGMNSRNAWSASARYAMILTFPLISLSIIALFVLLVVNDYSVSYVYQVVSNNTPFYLKITALWGGQSGSLLFWSWLMSAFAGGAMLRKWDDEPEMLPWVIVICLVTLVFFVGIIIFLENPFVRFWNILGQGHVIAMFPPPGATLLTPYDGYGLNPLLRHLGMVFHPPALYIGFVAFVIPYAYALASLITGRTDDRWVRLTRRWTLAAWLFLSLGLLLGSRWAYDVLGWGGYWGWDPVEISALMPWLAGTAFLHSIIMQERRGLFKQWNVLLIVLTYCLVIFGTFLTRSGVLSSVHAFTQSAMGPLFFGFISLTFAVSLGLLLYRWNDLRSASNPLPHTNSLLSREAFFLYNNLLFMGILVACFWGVIFPIVSELFTNQTITVGPPFYERATGPIFAALLLLMGVAPLTAWGRSTWKTLGKASWKPALVSILAPIISFLAGVRSPLAIFVLWLVVFSGCLTLYEYGRSVFARQRNTGENLGTAFWKLARRNRRRFGGYIIHIGIIFMALGITGMELLQNQTQVTVDRGSSLQLDSYTLTYLSLQDQDTADGRNTAQAVLSVSKDDKYIGSITPRRDYYYDSGQSLTIPGVRSTLGDDLYVILVDWEPITYQQATFKVYHNPLVNWLWIGGFVFVIGTLVAVMAGQKEKEQVQ